MILYIDAGNTQTKWIISNNNQDIKSGNFNNSDINDFVIKEQLDEVFISSVNSTQFNQQLVSQLSVPTEVIFFAQKNQKFLPYSYSEDLGVDRWLGCLFVSKKVVENAILIDAGTAITIDFIKKGEHSPNFYEAGVILPGMHMFFNSLQRNTKKISLSSSEISDQIHDTDSAVMHGFFMAVNGAIYKFIQFYELDKNNLMVFISGGDGLSITRSRYFDFSQSHTFIQNSVINGLKIYRELTFSDK